MSQAFVRENDAMMLQDVPPSLAALKIYLTNENNGIRVYEIKNYVDKKGIEIHDMSNGLSYAKDKEGKWYVV